MEDAELQQSLAKEGRELYREVLRFMPTAEPDYYLVRGVWQDEIMRLDIEILLGHREEAAAPPPIPLEEVVMPDLPTFKPMPTSSKARPERPPTSSKARPERPTSKTTSKVTSKTTVRAASKAKASPYLPPPPPPPRGFPGTEEDPEDAPPPVFPTSKAAPVFSTSKAAGFRSLPFSLWRRAAHFAGKGKGKGSAAAAAHAAAAAAAAAAFEFPEGFSNPDDPTRTDEKWQPGPEEEVRRRRYWSEHKSLASKRHDRKYRRGRRRRRRSYSSSIESEERYSRKRRRSRSGRRNQKPWNSREKAEEAKDAGNKSFQAKRYMDAIRHYTEAIRLYPTDHVFYSNRAIAYAALFRHMDALTDAKECVRLKPNWWKGYLRKGTAEFHLDRLVESEATFKKGLGLLPDEQSLKDGLAQVRLALALRSKDKNGEEMTAQQKGQDADKREAEKPATAAEDPRITVRRLRRKNALEGKLNLPQIIALPDVSNRKVVEEEPTSGAAQKEQEESSKHEEPPTSKPQEGEATLESQENRGEMAKADKNVGGITSSASDKEPEGPESVQKQEMANLENKTGEVTQPAGGKETESLASVKKEEMAKADKNNGEMATPASKKEPESLASIKTEEMAKVDNNAGEMTTPAGDEEPGSPACIKKEEMSKADAEETNTPAGDKEPESLSSINKQEGEEPVALAPAEDKPASPQDAALQDTSNSQAAEVQPPPDAAKKEADMSRQEELPTPRQDEGEDKKEADHKQEETAQANKNTEEITASPLQKEQEPGKPPATPQDKPPPSSDVAPQDASDRSVAKTEPSPVAAQNTEEISKDEMQETEKERKEVDQKKEEMAKSSKNAEEVTTAADQKEQESLANVNKQEGENPLAPPEDKTLPPSDAASQDASTGKVLNAVSSFRGIKRPADAAQKEEEMRKKEEALARKIQKRKEQEQKASAENKPAATEDNMRDASRRAMRNALFGFGGINQEERRLHRELLQKKQEEEKARADQIAKEKEEKAKADAQAKANRPAPSGPTFLRSRSRSGKQGRSRRKALEAKDAGNKAFQAQRFAEAIRHYSEAIKLDPTDAVFFSNRSGSYAGLSQYTDALTDAKECVRLKPDWWKGYSRKGTAEFQLGRLSESESSFKKGLGLQPEEQSLKDGLAQVRLAVALGVKRK